MEQVLYTPDNSSFHWYAYVDPNTELMYTVCEAVDLRYNSQRLIIIDESFRGWYSPLGKQTVSSYDKHNCQQFLERNPDLPLKPFPSWFIESQPYRELLEKLSL